MQAKQAAKLRGQVRPWTEVASHGIRPGFGQVAIGIATKRHSSPAIGDWTGLEVRELEQPAPDHLLLDIEDGTISIPGVGEFWPCIGPQASGLQTLAGALRESGPGGRSAPRSRSSKTLGICLTTAPRDSDFKDPMSL